MEEYISLKQYADSVGKVPSAVLRAIQSGKLPAVRVGNQWCVKAGTPYPADGRVKSGKYKDWRKKPWLNSDHEDEEE